MEIKCPKCGAPLENGQCSYCGYHSPVPKKEPEVKVESEIWVDNYKGVFNHVSKKNKTIALLLCIFTGYFGLHRFYVGKIGSGILYALTAGLGGIGWIVDIVLIATGSFKDEFDLPLK